MRNLVGCDLHSKLDGVTGKALFHAYDCDPCLRLLLKCMESYLFGPGLLGTALRIFMRIARKHDPKETFADKCKRARLLRKTYRVITHTVVDFKKTQTNANVNK